jgi:L-alanine-DL-glutamate epimerase-like enolase superfamily enzyme
MKITRVEAIPIQVPMNPKLAIKSGRGGWHDVSKYLLVRIHTDAGIVGLGEASVTPKWSGEDQITAMHYVNNYFAPLLVGEEAPQGPAQIEALTKKYTFPVAENYFTKSAIDTALWDIAGQITGKPVYELLGGKKREFVHTKWSVSAQPPPRPAEIARWAYDQGFRKMKVKLGVDANGGWVTPAVAIPTIKRLQEFNIYFAEQPVNEGDIEGMAEVRAAVDLPIVADESVYTLSDAKALAARKACDVFSIYIGKAGGITGAKAIADFALQAGITCVIGSNLELGVGSAAMTHLALSHAAFVPEKFPSDIIGPFFFEDDILKPSLPLKPGEARVFDKPGLGIELDEEKIERYKSK